MSTNPKALSGEDHKRYKGWLEKVRQILLSLTVLDYDHGKPYRRRLFNDDLVLDEKAWRHFWEDRYWPHKAVKEDMGLPWIEYKPHTILM